MRRPVLHCALSDHNDEQVGVYDDTTVARVKGPAFPIQSLYERVLSVLQCRYAGPPPSPRAACVSSPRRYVDEVVMGSPYVHTEEMLKALNVSLGTRVFSAA
jgi:hypothetical protein